MLEVDRQRRSTVKADQTPRLSSFNDTMSTVTGIVRRRYFYILITLICTISIGLAYLFTTPPTFSSTATMVIDPHKLQLFQQQNTNVETPNSDNGGVATEIEILKSDNISRAVVKNLDLVHDPEFVGAGSSLLGRALGTLQGWLVGTVSGTASDAQLEARAVGTLSARRTVLRIGTTYAIEISVVSLSPAKAATIANAIGDAYIVDQLESKYQATKRASIWLQDRIKELRSQASDAQRAVVTFKHDNNILQSGGEMMNERSMVAGNSQLLDAQAATSEAKARLDRIQQVLSQPFSNATVADELKNDIISKLRQSYLDLVSRRDLLQAKVGPRHLAVISLNDQIGEVQNNLVAELQRLAQTFKSDYAIAQAREQSLKENLAAAVSETKVTDKAQVEMRELETNAETYRSLYTNFMQRYMEAVQQQSWPFTEARLITPATPSSQKSAPKSTLIMAMAIFGGLMAGFGLAAFRELSDRGFRTSRKVEQVLGINCLAMVPLLTGSEKAKVAQLGKNASLVGGNDPATGTGLSTLPPPTNPTLTYSIKAPLSRFTESIRALKIAADLNSDLSQSKVIGITSTLPHEGKTTLASNFAYHIANSGARTLLIDGDFRNPSLSRGMGTVEGLGIIEIIAGTASIGEAIRTDVQTGLDFLPSGMTTALLHTSEVFSSAAMLRLVEELRNRYDYIVFDLPPLAPVVDVRVTTRWIDGYLYVVAWGATDGDVVAQQLSDAQEVANRTIGVVLNKVDTAKVGLYEPHKGAYYYKHYYSRYGYIRT